jgi:acyl-coenzyme A synthetase/AMP-(fatty) acid ligase
MVAQSGLHVIVTIIALNRLGYTTFLISTRLASPALVQLLTLADCRTVLTTPTYEPVLAEVSKEREIVTLPLIMHSDYYGKTAPVVTRAYDPESETKKVAVIIHSSGSTGLPKPIYLTNYSIVSAAAVHMNMRALLTSPLFHSHGFYEVFRSIYSKKPLYIYNYALPLTNQNVVKAVEYVKPEIFHTVPYVIKMVAESEEGIQTLTSIRLILYGGSSFPEDLGNQLVKRGVFLAANYGV